MTAPWLLFDLGNVVVRLAKPYRPRFFDVVSGAEREHLYKILNDDFEIGKKDFSLTERFQIGRITSEEFLATIQIAIGGKLTVEEIRQEANNLLLGEDEGTAAIIGTLASTHRLACLSNTHEIHWEYMMKNFPVMKHFQKPFSSFGLGIAKPEPECYLEVCRQLKVPPSDVVLIDDREKNIVGARAVGMGTIHFSDSKRFRSQLNDLGISV